MGTYLYGGENYKNKGQFSGKEGVEKYNSKKLKEHYAEMGLEE